MRACNQCEQTKDDSAFYAKGNACRECHRARQRVWDMANRARKLEINREWRKRNPARRALLCRAQGIVWRALQAGKLVRGTTCAHCQGNERLEAAHVDYGRPLDVLWLCIKCHRAWDAAEPKS